MLKRVVVLNSKLYGKADIRLDDSESIQLVGSNNIGKSTLIYALNFLFVVDGAKMTFSGQRRGDKETIHHYFPTPNQSYIVFEIEKSISYCIIVKRDIEGDLEYYKISSAYDENYFFSGAKGTLKLKKFDEVQETLEKKGVELYQFKNKSEVFNTVYERGRKNDAVVWLEDSVKSDGLSNNFSKIYRYLINSKLITNKSLKESLIIADSRENEGVNFSQKNKKDVTDLLRINDEIKNIKAIKTDFAEFREMVYRYQAKTQSVAGYLYAFNSKYLPVLEQLESKLIEKEKEITKIQTDLTETLKPQDAKLNQLIGEKNSAIEIYTEQLQKKEFRINEINKFDSKSFLSQSLENLEKQRKDAEIKITAIESGKITAKSLEVKLTQILGQIKRFEEQAKNYDNLLIHQLASKPADKKLLNTILGPQITALPKESIKKPIKKTGNVLQIFDGEIQLPKDLQLIDFQSVDEIKEQIKELKEEKKNTEALLKVATGFEKSQKELKVIISQIEEIKEKLRQINEKPILEKELDANKAQVNELKKEQSKLVKQLDILKKDIAKSELSLKVLEEEKRGLDARARDLRLYKQELETIGLDPIPYEASESMEDIFRKIKLQNEDRMNLKLSKDKTFDTIRFKTNSSIADEEEFIRFIEDEIACIEDKERSIEGLLASISAQFANPAYTLLKRYEEFREFMEQKFNPKIATTRISDIESLKIELLDNKKIISELKLISAIQEDMQGQLKIGFDQSENLKVLNNYLDTGKKINFGELFDIELHLHIKGQEKKVDLADQVESDGTDKMIRLIIVMSVINHLTISDQKNRIALFIDEVATIDKNNRPELVRFCKEHRFIPIFAAPDAVPDFNKYYFIFPSKGKININDSNVAWQQEYAVN